MYIETSSPRVAGDNAILASPPYSTSQLPACLQFWYHMYGSGTGTLNVRVGTGGAVGNVVWTKVGNQGNKWQRGETPLAANKANFQIQWEGIVGKNAASDIAIDDVVILNGTCGGQPGREDKS